MKKTMDLLRNERSIYEATIDKDKMFEEILKMFQENPKPEDSVIHVLSDKLKINTHIFEGFIYELLGGFISAGKSFEDKFKESDADPKQLEIGTLVEMEHTTIKVLSKKIALDHLAEHSNYYTKLIKAGLVDEKPALNLYKKYFG